MTNTVLQHLISDNCRKYFVHKPKVFKKNWAIERDDQAYKDTGRVYKVDDKIYPSITTICKILTEKYIEQWEQQVGKQEAERIRNLAARRGTKIHQLSEDIN
jgi:predicted nuclease of restriction endonuclease-like RecB superfamily